MSPGAERTALAVSVLGKAAMELMPTLNSGVEGIADMKQEANDLGLVLDDTAIKTGVGLADALDKLQETMGSLAVKVITPLVPVVTQLADAFVAVIPGIIDLVKPLIAKLAPVLSDMIQKIMPVLLQLFDKFGPILMDVIGVVMQLTTSAIVPLLGVLLPLIASMANALIPAFMKILDVILPLLPPLLEIIQMIFPALMEVINVLITEALNILIEIFRQLSPVIAIVLDILKQLIQAGVLELIKAFLPLIASILPVLTELIQLLLPILTTFLTILLKVAQYVIPIVVESLTSLVRIISGSVSQCFKLLGDVIEGAANIGKEAFDGLLAWIRPVANSVIGFINGIIKGLNSISVTLPDWMPGVGGEHFGVNLPLIPALAKGGTASKAGWAIVGEQGPELIHLSRGAEVVPLASGQNQVIIDRGAFAGAFILDDYGVDKLLDRLVQRLKIYGVRP